MKVHTSENFIAKGALIGNIKGPRTFKQDISSWKIRLDFTFIWPHFKAIKWFVFRPNWAPRRFYFNASSKDASMPAGKIV